MKTILILYATFTGNTQEAAASLHADLVKKFPDLAFDIANIWDKSKASDILAYDAVLFGSSTWEDALNPDAAMFLEGLKKQQADLSPVPMALFGLGDSSYEIFCAALPDIQTSLEKLGVKIYQPIFTIDGYPTADKLRDLHAWAEQYVQQLHI